MKIRSFKLGAFLAFGSASLVANGPAASAAYFDCFSSNHTFTYHGQEVECGAQWKQAMCEAGCDYCFDTGCVGIAECDAGDEITGVCNNIVN